jgi:hypothetical protein
MFSLQMFVGTCMPDKIFLADYPIICSCKSNYLGNKRGHQRTSAYIYPIFCEDGSRNSCVLYTGFHIYSKRYLHICGTSKEKQ